MKALAARAWALLKRWWAFALAAFLALSPVLNALADVDLGAILTAILGATWGPAVAGVVLLLAALAKSPLFQKDPAP